jgi:hypothetical protein
MLGAKLTSLTSAGGSSRGNAIRENTCVAKAGIASKMAPAARFVDSAFLVWIQPMGTRLVFFARAAQYFDFTKCLSQGDEMRHIRNARRFLYICCK